jgi:hypothetical protein
MLNKRYNREIPRDDATLRLECIRIVKRIVDRINNKRASTRSIAKKANVSNVLIHLICKNPDRKLSRKVMKKFVQSFTRRDLIQTVKLIHREKGLLTCPK